MLPFVAMLIWGFGSTQGCRSYLSNLFRSASDRTRATVLRPGKGGEARADLGDQPPNIPREPQPARRIHRGGSHHSLKEINFLTHNGFPT